MKTHLIFGTHATIAAINRGASIDEVATGHYELVTFTTGDHPVKVLEPLVRWDGYAVLHPSVWNAIAHYGLSESTVVQSDFNTHS
jgi:hypothetical protein